MGYEMWDVKNDSRCAIHDSGYGKFLIDDLPLNHGRFDARSERLGYGMRDIKVMN